MTAFRLDKEAGVHEFRQPMEIRHMKKGQEAGVKLFIGSLAFRDTLVAKTSEERINSLGFIRGAISGLHRLCHPLEVKPSPSRVGLPGPTIKLRQMLRFWAASQGLVPPKAPLEKDRGITGTLASSGFCVCEPFLRLRPRFPIFCY